MTMTMLLVVIPTGLPTDTSIDISMVTRAEAPMGARRDQAMVCSAVLTAVGFREISERQSVELSALAPLVTPTVYPVAASMERVMVKSVETPMRNPAADCVKTSAGMPKWLISMVPAESPTDIVTGDFTGITEGFQVEAPSCRSIGTGVTVVNFRGVTFAGEARVVLVANRKGGVGKSSLVAAAAHAIASGGRGAGHKVLIIDGDPQGTITKSDLGARENNDGGSSLGSSLLFAGNNLEPLVEVKPNLDLIAGGSVLSRAIAAATAVTPEELVSNFQSALERLCSQRGYDFVFIDSAPGEMPLLDTFMSTANYLVVPTQSDGGSLDGVADVALSFKKARRDGAEIALLGVALFGADANAHVRNADVFAQIEELLGASGVAPFRTLIREAKAAAIDCRNLGITPVELVGIAKQARKDTFKALGAGEKPGRTIWSGNPAKLASDYQALVYEIVSRIAQYEAVDQHTAMGDLEPIAATGG